MTNFFPLLLLLLSLFLGFFLGKLLPNIPDKILRIFQSIVLYLLLLFMGWGLSRNPMIRENLSDLGWQGFLFSAASLAGTALLILIFLSFSGGLRESRRRRVSGKQAATLNTRSIVTLFRKIPLWEPVSLILIITAGFIIGLLPLFDRWEIGTGTFEAVCTCLLYALLFGVGLRLGKEGWRQFRGILSIRVLIFPLCTAIGTMLGGVVMALWQQISIKSGLLIVSGFGWYTLSGAVLTSYGEPVLGAVSFLCNVFREMMALIIIPVLGLIGSSGTDHSAQIILPSLGIGFAGATSMDVTLPMVAKFFPEKYVPVSLYHGTVLSLIVPVLIPMIFQWM